MADISINLHEKRMRELIEYSSKSLVTSYPSPFGASIYDTEGNLLAQTYDTVIKNADPTCHGEINAIRDAVKKVKNMSLKNCIIYCTCEPCPMCMAAIIWAEIDVVVYATTIQEDAALYWPQPINMSAQELASKMPNSRKILIIPDIEQKSAQSLFKNCQLAISKD